ncbi:unnamed protein product, partial [Tetraodon nigroviridis]
MGEDGSLAAAKTSPIWTGRLLFRVRLPGEVAFSFRKRLLSARQDGDVDAKGRRDGVSSAPDNPRPPMATRPGREGVGVGWRGPRTLVLHKNSQGFGFTLRHFIVYPPESTLHANLKDEENGNEKGYQKSRMEPMDTIFVKSVREKGPAHQAGLCTGDRLVKVNGESVLGKTYSQVIALIQNSECVLELSIMPKDEDVLQLAYSQDAYLTGNEPYSGGAENLPPPPPLCYPRSKTTPPSGAPAPAPMGQNQLDNWSRWPNSSSPSSPLDNRSTVGSPASWQEGRPGEPGGVGPSSPAHRTEEIQYGMTGKHPQGQTRGRSYSSSSSSGGLVSSPLQVHYPNHHAAGTSQAPPRKPTSAWTSPPLPQLSHSRNERCQQALSDWYYSQVPERSGRSGQIRQRSYSQDRLSDTRRRRQQQQQRAGDWPHSASQDTLLFLPQQQQQQPSGPGPHGEPYWSYADWDGASGRGPPAPNYTRTRSENLLVQYDCYGRSLETLDPAAGLVSPRFERPSWIQQVPQQPHRTDAYPRQGGHYGAAPPVSRHVPHHSQPQPQQAASQSRRLPAGQSMDDQPVGYRSYSPSFYRKTGRIMQQAHSFRDPSYSGPHLNWNPNPKSPPEGDTAPTTATAASPLTSSSPETQSREYRPTNHERDQGPEEEGQEEAVAQTQEVVLRQKPPTGRRNAFGMRHPHYALPVDGLEPSLFSPEDSAPAPGSREDGAPRKPNGNLAPVPNEDDSLASIPFIARLFLGSCKQADSSSRIGNVLRLMLGSRHLRNAEEKRKEKSRTKAQQLFLWQPEAQVCAYLPVLTINSVSCYTRQPPRFTGFSSSSGSSLPSVFFTSLWWMIYLSPLKTKRKTNVVSLSPGVLLHSSSLTYSTLLLRPYFLIPNPPPPTDEPTSPSADLRARHVPASSVVSSGMSSAPAMVTSPSSPTFHFPPTRLFSHDCSSIKSSRRSSYLLAITAERSKSCDEGLNTFREEGRVFLRLPKRVKSFFTDGVSSARRCNWMDGLLAPPTHGVCLPVAGQPEVGRGGPLQAPLHLRAGKHHLQRRAAGGVAALQTNSHGEGQESRQRHASVEESVFGAPLPFTLPLQGQEGGRAPGGHHRRRHRRRAADQHPGLPGGHRLQRDQAEARAAADHAGLLRVPAAGGGPGGHVGLDKGHQGEQQDGQRGGRTRLHGPAVVSTFTSPNRRRPLLQELGFSGQALISKKLNDYRKHSPTGNKPDSSPRLSRMKPPFLLAKTENSTGAPRSPKPEGKALCLCPDESGPLKSPWGINIMKKSKKVVPKAFGVRLEDCQPGVNNKFIPLIVEICCGLVEEMGLEYTGIYRVPGNNAMVSLLQDQLNKGVDINPAEEKWQDLNVVSSLLKSFFRKLPEPLFTNDKYNDFIDANRMENASERLKTLKKLIRDLPDHYYHTLKFLMGHLKTVADSSDKNKMEPRNLALVFGPTLVRTSEDNMKDMVTHMPDRYKIVETLIQHGLWFFTDELDKDEKTPVDTEDVQPAPNIDHLLSNIGRTGLPGEAS